MVSRLMSSARTAIPNRSEWAGTKVTEPRIEPLNDSEWLHSVGLTMEVDCARCGATFESPDPKELDNWMRTHACAE
jgi:hypothetical protein